MGYLLGYDVGSSAVKAALVDIESGSPVAAAVSPADELPIQAPRPGWAEQDPGLWWTHIVSATHELAADQPAALREVKAIGLSYQMHGLVLVDRALQVLRPAILWCDSRAAEIGHQAFRELGAAACMRRLLNSPGNFTASKLKWVRDEEPDVFARVHRALLPGDYVALRMTGEDCDHAHGTLGRHLVGLRRRRPGADGAVALRNSCLVHSTKSAGFFGARSLTARCRRRTGDSGPHPSRVSQRRPAPTTPWR